MTSLPHIKADGFIFTPSIADGAINVHISGNADMRVVPELDAALEAIAAALPLSGTEKVVFEIKSLYFMNSSCFKCFVTLLVTILDLPKGQRVEIVFLSNPRLHWQDRSLEALRSIASEIVRIQVS